MKRTVAENRTVQPLFSLCKNCTSWFQNGTYWFQKHMFKRKKNDKKYYQKNKEKIKEILKNNYIEDSPDLILELLAQQKEEIIEVINKEYEKAEKMEGYDVKKAIVVMNVLNKIKEKL